MNRILMPMGYRVLLKRVKEDTGSLVVPKTANQEDKAIGEVVALSEDVSITLSVGDKVVYNEFSGDLVPGEEDLLLIDATDILARYVQPSV